MILPTPRSTLFPYTTLFRSDGPVMANVALAGVMRHDLAAIESSEAGVKETPLLNLGEVGGTVTFDGKPPPKGLLRSEEHTSELQSHSDLVCRLLLEKKKQKE